MPPLRTSIGTAGRTAAWVLWLLATTANARQLPVPPLDPGGESGTVTAFDEDGSERWSAAWRVTPDTLGDDPVYRMHEDGAGTYSGFDEDVRWTTGTIWSARTPFVPLESEKTFTDATGRVLARLDVEFDQEAGRARFSHEDLRTGEATEETRELPEGTIWVEGIAAAIRAIPFEETSSIETYLFTPEAELYEVTLEVREMEVLQTSNGPVGCYRVEVVPHLGLLGLFRFLLPRAYFWVAVEEPHTFIRYEGPENGRGTPTIRMERSD